MCKTITDFREIEEKLIIINCCTTRFSSKYCIPIKDKLRGKIIRTMKENIIYCMRKCYISFTPINDFG